MSDELRTDDEAQRGMLGRVVRGTLNYGLGAVVPQIVGFLLIPLYTAVLSPTDYGVLDLAGTLGAALVIVMRVGVPGAVARFYYEHSEGPPLRDYVTTVMIFLCGGGLVVGALVMALAPSFGPIVVPGVSTMPQILLVVTSAFLMAASELQRRLVQAREQSVYSARLSVARGLGEIGFAMLFVLVYRKGATGMLLANAVVSALFFVQALSYLAPELRGRFSRPMLRESLIYASAVLPSHLIGTVAPLLTRSLLTHADSIAAVGTFGIAMRFASPLRLVATAFSSAYLPVYFAMRKGANEANTRSLAQAARTLVLGSIALALAASLFGPPTLRLMTPEAFHDASIVLPILALEFLAQMVYLLLGPELFYVKRPMLVPIVSLAGAVATITVAVVAIERFGIHGMALGLLAGSVTSACLAALLGRRLFAMPHQWGAYLRVFVVATGSYGATRLVLPADPWAELGVAVAGLVGFVFVLWVIRDPAMLGALGRRTPIVSPDEGQ